MAPLTLAMSQVRALSSPAAPRGHPMRRNVQLSSRRSVECAFFNFFKKEPEPVPESVPETPAPASKPAPVPTSAGSVVATAKAAAKAAAPAAVEKQATAAAVAVAVAEPAPAAAAAAAEAAPAPVQVLQVQAGAEEALSVGGRTIKVGKDGSIIIGGGAPRGLSSKAVDARDTVEVEYLTGRAALVQKHFDSAIGADDFIQRVEMALYAFGFTGENSIAMVNLCRDEVTFPLKQKIDTVFGASFSTNGLGGVLTCGTIGMGAGFSHSPVCDSSGKERYIFFSFPHISINSKGDVGPMSRPGRPGQSCACGALIASWNQLREEGVTPNCKIPGVHDALNPEFSILKQRISRRLRYEGVTNESVKGLSLVDVTKVAERTISDDLEYLISKTVDTSKADYAVITGVQVHNWANDFEDDSPNIEFVAPTSAYVVVDGKKTHIELAAMPPLTPRQINLLHGGDTTVVCNQGGQSTLRAEDPLHASDSKDARRMQKTRLQSYLSLMKQEGLEGVASVPKLALRATIATDTPARCATADNSTINDERWGNDAELKQLQAELNEKYQMPR